MKNYNEMAENVFRRRDEYVKIKSKRKKFVIKLISILSSFVIVFLIGGGILFSMLLSSAPKATDIADISSILSESQSEKSEASNEQTAPENPHSNSSGIVSGDKSVSSYAFEENVTSNEEPYDDYYDDYYYDNDYDQSNSLNKLSVITGIDELNYYSGKKIIENEAVNMSGSCRAPKPVTLLNTPVLYRAVTLSDSTKVYHSLDFWTEFSVSSVIYFQIDIWDENGFLASKLGGLGTAEVVITENNINPMITFKMGNRYYSCLENGRHMDDGWESIDFSAHKYIEGCYIVKDKESPGSIFKIILENDTVTAVECRLYGFDQESPITADMLTVVPDSTITSNNYYSFTVADLEKTFG